MALLQSNIGGAATVTSVTPQNFTSTAAGFASPTSAGSLLVMSGWITAGFNTLSSNVSLATPPPLGTSSWATTQLALGIPSGIGYWVIENAPSIATTSTTKAIGVLTGSGFTVSSATVEFALWEFSNMVTASAKDVVQFAHSANSVPNAGGLTTTAVDIVMQTYVARGGPAISAGTGYTLGIAGSAVIESQTQYQLSVPASTVTTAFVGTQTGTWISLAVSYKASTVTAAAVFAYSFPVLIGV